MLLSSTIPCKQLDCGVHPAYKGMSSLPFFDYFDEKRHTGLDLAEVDLILISHFHLDHIAALPYILERSNFQGRVFMTHPTKSIYRLIVQDFVRVSALSAEEALYTEQDLENTMSKIETVNYHQTIQHKGIKFWCYNAGHVLGAAMFMIEIAGVKVLYTGDYSRSEDRHLMAAETPETSPDILVVESTYGISNHEPVAARERMFTETVRKIVRGRGKCLIPQFALGRAQELLLILDEFWEANPSLQEVPIYYASALAKRCLGVYQTFINMMNKRIQEQAQIANPFVFRHVRSLKGVNQFEDTGPCVVMASPGMLQNGLSRELFEAWCSDKRNGVIIAGYCVEGTLAHNVLSMPKYVKSLQGLQLEMNMSVANVPFSAHADYKETSEFVDILKPAHVILVHGEEKEMGTFFSMMYMYYACA